MTSKISLLSSRLKKTSEFQEFQVDTTNYVVTVEKVVTSGYSNDVVRFQFYFERAVKWYMLTFVYLYIILTYMSFGMFFLDHQVGERLGYGKLLVWLYPCFIF